MKTNPTKNNKLRLPGQFFRLLILACLPLIPTFGQVVKLDMPQIFPVSPEAAVLDKFHSYPVDYCTGVPQISIPLYEIVAGDITLPVTLSYHASGLKPHDGSGLAGTNWSLSLEPTVSREIRGTDDTGNYGWLREGSYHRGTPPGASRMDRINFMDEVVRGIRDSQPDRFTYSLPHAGGSGYMLYQGSPMVTCPRTNDVVNWDRSDKMTITDDKGYYYEFDGVVEKVFYTQSINRWHCTSIRSPHRTTPSVTFEYDILPHQSTGTNKGCMGLGEVIINKNAAEDGYNLTEHFPLQEHNYALVPDYNSGPEAYYYDYKAELSPVYSEGLYIDNSGSILPNDVEVPRLTDIRFLGNTMKISYHSVGGPDYWNDAYDTIEVTDEHGKPVRSIRFHLSTYNPHTSLTKLDSVSISAPGVETKTYKFHYNGGLNVPSIDTRVVDHWGFCNGPENRHAVNTVPSFCKILAYSKDGQQIRLLLDYKGANREANATWTSLGMLIQITDPQGLETHFEYEGNNAAFAMGYPGPEEEGAMYLRPVGGLRVKHIRTYDPEEQKTVHKRYSYGLEGSIGWGVIWGGGAIPHIITERDYQTSVLVPFSPTNLQPMTVIHNNPVGEITFHNGSPVLYSNVRESIEGGGSTLVTEYVYHVPFHEYNNVLEWDQYDPELNYAQKEKQVNDYLLKHSYSELKGLVCPLPNNPGKHADEYTGMSDDQWLAGKLKRVDRYKDNGFFLSTTEYEYEHAGTGGVVSIDIPVRRISVSSDVCLDNPGAYSWDNVFNTGSFYPAQDGGPAQSTFYLDPGSYTFLTRESTVETREQVPHDQPPYEFESYKETKTFEYEFSHLPGVSLEPRRITTVRSDEGLSVDEYDYLDGQFPGILSMHRHTEGDSWKEDRILFREGTSLPGRVVSATDRETEFRDEVVYTAYDLYNNVAEVHSKDGTPITYLWGYRGRFPVAMIENATRSEVLAAMGVDAGEADGWAGDMVPAPAMLQALQLLRASLPEANVYTCEYEPLQGVVAVTDPNGITTRHEYDGFNRLTRSYYLDPAADKVLLQQYLYHLGEK